MKMPGLPPMRNPGIEMNDFPDYFPQASCHARIFRSDRIPRHSRAQAGKSYLSLCKYFSLYVGYSPASIRNRSSGTTSNPGPSLSQIDLTRATSLFSLT